MSSRLATKRASRLASSSIALRRSARSTYMDVAAGARSRRFSKPSISGAARQGLAPCWPSASRCCGCRRDRPPDQRRRSTSASARAAARTDGRDPEGARRGRRATPRRSPSCARRSTRPACRKRRGARRQGAAPAQAHARRLGRIRHDPHLARLDGRAALGGADAAADRHRRGAQDPRRRPLRPGEDQDPHHRVSGGAQARAGGQGADPLLRRTAGRRQDLARPVDRPRHGPQVRAHQPGRRARRGRDPRPPAHLCRRAAGQHHPGHPHAPARATA